MIIDSHCHLYDEKLNSIRQDILDSLQKTALYCVTCGDSPQSSKESVSLAQSWSNVFATVGTHPHEAKDFVDQDLALYRELAKDEKVVAVGEIGLDYYYDFTPRAQQIEVLKKQILLAHELNLPCVFHVREATKDFLDILQEFKGKFHSGVVHSFNGSLETAKILLENGFYLSFNGIATFNNARNVLDIIKMVPCDRFLIETDSPYLAPVPHRGEVNQPKYVELVSQKIAEVKGLDKQEVLRLANQNAIRLFNLPLKV